MNEQQITELKAIVDKLSKLYDKLSKLYDKLEKDTKENHQMLLEIAIMLSKL